MKLRETTFESILAAVARTPPAIGGSTAASLSALIAIALMKMALLITHEKTRMSALEQPIERLDSLSARLSDAAETDREALQRYLAAVDDKESGTAALIDATSTPFASAHIMMEAIELAHLHAPVINNVAISDYYAGLSC